MSSGWVLQFSNRTFEEFFREVVREEIYHERYNLGSGSKAQRMRAFWQVATKDQMTALFNGLLEAWEIYANEPIPDSAKHLLQSILNRLNGGAVATASHRVDPVTQPISDSIAKALFTKLVEITALAPQQRGFEFERFLKDLFNAYHLSARAAFRLTGEQIDGSFVMHNETYLLEAKWENPPTGATDLHTFEGKLGQKAVWSRGLFVSISGFSSDGLEAFGKAKRIVCMDGFDLSEMLRLRLSFIAVLEAKVRRAAETGSPFVSVRNLTL
jgi:hypothetical protein